MAQATVENITIKVNAETQQAQSGMQRLSTVIANLNVNIEQTETATESASKSGSNAQRVISAISKAGKRFTSIVKSMTKALAKFASVPFKPLISQMEKFASTIKKIRASIERVVMYRLLRGAIKALTQGISEGIENLYYWATIVGNDFAPTMDTLASEFLYLKNSIGAALSPIIQALEPIIVNLINKFVELLNVFNQFVSAMSGKTTYRRALYYATQYADEMDDAGKAAKELRDILMDFDQLNLIKTPRDSGRGNDDALDYALMFEEVPIDEGIINSLNNVDWENIGKKIADKIARMLNGIDWTSIKQKTIAFADRAASFLNGIFGSEELFTSLGKTVGEGLNTITSTINEFFEKTNWVELGKNLSKGFKTLIETADAGSIGRAIAAPFASLADIIHGFATDMTTEDWERVKNEIYWVFSYIMNSIDWETLIPDLVELTTGFIKAITGAIKGIASAKEEIKRGVKAADWQSFKAALAELIESLCKDIPVIPIALTFSLTGVLFDVASKALVARLFSSAIAKALGGTVATSGGSALAAGGASAGAGALSAALPYIAIGLGVIITLWASWNWAEEQAKLLKETQTPEPVTAGPGMADLLDLNNEKYHYHGYGDSRVQEALAHVEDYRKKLEYLRKALKPQHLGLPNTAENVNGLTYRLEELSKALASDEPYSVANAAAIINEYFEKAGGNFTEVGEGMIKTYGKVEEKTKAVVGTANDATNQALKDLEDLQKSGKITFGQMIEMRRDLESGTPSAINKVLGKINELKGVAKGALDIIQLGVQNTNDNLRTEFDKTGQSITSSIETITRKWRKFSESGSTWGEEFRNGLMTELEKLNSAKITMNPGQQASWNNTKITVQRYADGGFPDMGSMFVAGESGAEMVGSINGRTGVVSGDEISGIASAVYGTGAEEAALLRELIGAVKTQRLVISPSASLGKVVNQSTRLYAGVTG